MTAASATFAALPLTAKVAALAGASALGRVCKLAFSCGLEKNPLVADRILAKLSLETRHAHVTPYTGKIKPSANHISLKHATDAFSGMPKKYATHRDGWTREMLRNTTETPSIVDLLRKFAEAFSNGKLPKYLWPYLASALL